MPRRFRAPHLPAPGERVALSPEVSHHLLVVCLTPRGQAVVLFDGEGAECEARLVDGSDGVAVVEATGPARRAQDDALVVLIAGLTRKPAWELSLRMATELGVTEIRPFVAARSVANKAHEDRWLRILEDAARQSGRTTWPHLAPLAPLPRQLEGCEALRRLALTPGAPALPLTSTGGVALLLGPEGGLGPDELATAARQGFEPAGLGPWTLRADTAVAAALARYRP
ncbi:MAG: RsmE family RNA methyltransferase [Alphaproteobacteria bacterium]|nr:RsmE family RNA methyltransferase [Alphaproteobacteria bacterium]